VIGGRLRLEARVEPSGPLRVEIWRDGRRTVAREFASSARIGLGTRHAASFRIRVTAAVSAGWAPAQRVLRASVVQPNLALGSRGPSVRALEQRLRDLHYALPSLDGYFGLDTAQAVLAFQNVNGLARTGRVDARLWRTLARANVPRARFGGTHIEVSKGRQVLFVVREGEVALVVHVSTGATGNTPLGTFHVYRKVVGWDWVLWYPMYFVRGFAIHGYPSVPAYPASHGCVRVPMWVAPRLFASNPWGQTVYVYW
jgi:lipoprotein-anchoring transpeptidase ErfK/SrfK